MATKEDPDAAITKEPVTAKCNDSNKQSFVAIIVTTLLLMGLLFGSSKAGDYYIVKNNWGEYRCQMEIMLFASMFGHDTMENLQFCLGAGFNARAAVSVSPFYGILAGFTTTLMTLLSSINSVRMVFANLVGSISQVFGEFSSRVQALMYRIQATAIRIKFLMSRVFGTMYSIVYMGMSGIKATQNFSRTPMFKFIEWMACFPPETPLAVKGKGMVEMKDVQIGDTLENGPRVTGTVRILGDGQQMVDIKDCSVSASHYIYEDERWILSMYSKRATKGEIWDGGAARPLTCLVTSNHRLPIGDLLFSDYHETESADQATMTRIINRLNGASSVHSYKNYVTGVAPETEILLEDGTYCPAHSIQLGTRVRHGTIMAIMIRECSTFTEHNGERFGYATAVKKGKSWLRGDTIIVETGLCITFAVSPSAILQTRANQFRDMFELHDLDIQTEYAKEMTERKKVDYVLK
jgi:hypothetical protein